MDTDLITLREGERAAAAVDGDDALLARAVGLHQWSWGLIRFNYWARPPSESVARAHGFEVLHSSAPAHGRYRAVITKFDARDIEYLRNGDGPLLARLYTPRGPGPFPLLVECHGGGWCANDRFAERLRHEALAAHGVIAMALDFRSGDVAPYPASVQDVNYAVRWAKAHASELKTRSDWIGLSGMSSGGHLAMLAAMRPHDTRYAAIPLPDSMADATVRFVVLSWPVINPLSRYLYAKRMAASVDPPSWAAAIAYRHETYWRTETNMAEGNPVLALERGERVHMPAAIYFQAHEDALHNYRDPDSPFDGNEPYRFVDDYRRANGQITLEHVDLPPHTEHSPDMSGIGDAFVRMAAFVREHTT